MALIWADKVAEVTTTTGTGALTLGGPLTGYRAFSAVMTSPSDTCYYMITAVDSNGVPTGEWETGLGTYSALNTLTRTTVHASSNSGSVVTLSAGNKRVTLSQTAVTAAGWRLMSSWTWSTNVANVDFTNLGACVELLVIARNIRLGTSGVLAIVLSTDNGTSFFTGASDYEIVPATGVPTTAANLGLYNSAHTSTDRSGAIRVSPINVNSGIKIVERINRAADGPGFFVGSTSPVNAIRLVPTAGGNITAGTIYVFGK